MDKDTQGEYHWTYYQLAAAGVVHRWLYRLHLQLDRWQEASGPTRVASYELLPSRVS